MPETVASALVPEACLRYVGMESETEVACDPVERGAVRRFAQAIMDEDPIFWRPTKNNERYGGPAALSRERLPAPLRRRGPDHEARASPLRSSTTSCRAS